MLLDNDNLLQVYEKNKKKTNDFLLFLRNLLNCAIITAMEMYRSGHNEAHSKCVYRLIPVRGFESLHLRHKRIVRTPITYWSSYFSFKIILEFF